MPEFSQSRETVGEKELTFPVKKILLPLLALCVSSLASGEAAFFGLKGEVKIKSAEWWTDGGSTDVFLQDSDGSVLSIHYKSDVFIKDDYAGRLSVRFPNIRGSYLLRKGGDEMQTLLVLMRQASMSSFGTDNPGNKDVTRQSVGILMRILTRLEKQQKKSKAR